MHVPSYTFSLKFRRGLALAVPSFLRYCCARSLACSPMTSGTPLPGTYAKKPNAGGEGVADGSKLAWFILVQHLRTPANLDTAYTNDESP